MCTLSPECHHILGNFSLCLNYAVKYMFTVSPKLLLQAVLNLWEFLDLCCFLLLFLLPFSNVFALVHALFVSTICLGIPYLLLWWKISVCYFKCSFKYFKLLFFFKIVPTTNHIIVISSHKEENKDPMILITLILSSFCSLF